jgi:hypothetical protein
MANEDISSNIVSNYDPNATSPYDENAPIVFEIKQYVGKEDVVYSNYTNLVFISGQLERDERFSKYCNNDTYPIVYEYQLDGDSIMEFIQNFTNVKRIAFAFHGPKAEYTELPFINIGPLFSTDDLSNTPDNLSENVLFVKRLIQQFSLENIDFLGCKVLLHNEWKQYLGLLQNGSVVIGASDDDTGNIKYGGDWVMENTMENIQHIYFNEDLNNYVNLLVDDNTPQKLVPHQVDLPFTYNGVTYTTWDSWKNGFSYTRGINYNTAIFTSSRLLVGDNQYSPNTNVFDGEIFNPRRPFRHYWAQSPAYMAFPYYIVWKLDGLQTVNKLVMYTEYDYPGMTPKKFDIISSTANMTIPTANVTINPGALKNDSNWNVIQTVEETQSYKSGYVTNDDGKQTTDNKTYTFPSTEAKFIGIKVYSHMSSQYANGRLEEIVFYGPPPGPDTEAPVITLNGPSTVTMIIGDSYTDVIPTASDSRDGDLTSSIVQVGSVDPTTPGRYTVTYNVSDSAGNNAVEVVRTVTVLVPDVVPPLILLRGSSTINLNLNETYTELGATAYDERYGNVTDAIVTTGSVDTSVIGTYEIKYNVSDPLGNVAIEVVRTVNVVDAPIITLNGPELVGLVVRSQFDAENYTELNATATDGIDGDITNNIVITSNVNTLKDGTYEVRYNVSNSVGSKAIEIIRTVLVIRPTGNVSVETLKNVVPTIEETASDTITIPELSDKTILTTGTSSEKIAKRRLFMKEFFSKNSSKVSNKKVKISKDDLLGTSSFIAKTDLLIQRAENTEVPVDLSSLTEDEGIYTYIDNIADFVVLEISTGYKLKIQKLNESQYAVYEDYVNQSTVITKVMNEGETGTYSGFGYQIGSFSGPTDAELLSTPICFPSGTPVTTDQGDIKIELLNKNVNTINGKRIVDITETGPKFENLICFEKDSLGNNTPSMKTEMTPDHCVLYNGKFMKAIEVAEICENVYSIPFIQEKLYNVLMEKHDTMMVNNLCCETLNPDNILVHITSSDKYDIPTKQNLLNDYNALLME